MGQEHDDDLGGMADSTRLLDISDLRLGAEVSGGPGRVDPLPTGPKPWLEHVDESRDSEEWEVSVITKPLVMLGRVPNVADIVVDDESASRHHAAIAHQDGGFVLYDMDSTNGTFVDDARITKVPLSDGIEFRIGGSRFRFRTP